MSELKWGLIGASDIAGTRVIPAIRRVGGSVCGVFSTSSERGNRYAHENAIESSTTQLSELLSSDIDAIYISTRNELHYEQAIAAIDAGKHVLCEKPLALTREHAQHMVEHAKQKGVVLATNHHLPGSPLHQTVRDLVRAGRIGEVLSARVVHAVKLPDRLQGWRVGKDAPGGGVTLDITCHDASVLNPLLGSPVRVTSFEVGQGSWGDDVQDAIMTVIEYEGADGRPVLAQTHDAFTVPFDTTSLAVQGTLGSIVVSDAMTQDTPGTVTLTSEAGIEDIEVDTSEDLYDIVIRAFANATTGTGSPTATGQDGVNALLVALAAQESSRTSRAVPIDGYVQQGK